MTLKARSTATRNTCFAIISAIEEDLRAFIRDECEALGLSTILPSDSRAAAASRWQTDNRSSTRGHAENDLELLDYTDFSDLSKTIHATLKPHQGNLAVEVKAVADRLDALGPTRNRVCHSRPLEFDDLPKCLGASDYLLQLSDLSFPTLKYARQRLRDDPSFVLNLQIPEYWSLETQIHHNLPLPEFDETGFLGRDKDRREVHKLLRSHYPALTIVGEGGVGKTALALRCLYDLLDDSSVPYDAIVWVSLKTMTLTEGGIRELGNVLNSTLGLLSSVAYSLGTPGTADLSAEDLIAEIVEYLTEYRVLVAIDNLETISGAPLRNLLIGIPAGSKILFTSRVGLGEFETRYALQPLELGAAAALMRRFAQVLSVVTLHRSREATLKQYSKRLFNNPLLVKWFVASIARGSDPRGLLDRADQRFQDALAFFFLTLLDRLSLNERSVVDTLTSARRPLTMAELYYLSAELDHREIEGALVTLHNSSLVRRTTDRSGTFNYQLSEPATAFLSVHSPPSKEVYGRVQSKLKKLRRLAEQDDVAQARYRYDIFVVRTQSRDERIAAVYLSHALIHLRQEKFEEAKQQVAEAKKILPIYAEAYRVSSLIEAKAGETYRAIAELDQAVQLSPDSQIVRYTYAQCLMRELDDHEGALKHLRIAERSDTNEPTLLSAIALCQTRLGQYQEAAAIYDQLVATVADRPRRWQVTTLDQTAECYRRWAETNVIDKDLQGAHDHIERAFEIVSVALATHCHDSGTPYRLGRILISALTLALGKDGQYARDVLSKARDLTERLPNTRIDIREKDAEWLRVRLGPGLFDEFMALAGGVMRRRRGAPITSPAVAPRDTSSTSTQDGPTSARRQGIIGRIVSGARFGFIVADDGSEWFFHYNALVSRPAWSSVQIGGRVAFEEGTNDHGPCAVAVQLENR